MNTRVKVPRTTLIERVKEAIAKGEADAAAEMAKFEERIAKIAPVVLKEITDLSTRLSAMTADELTKFIGEKYNRYSRFSVEIDVKMPQKPHPYNPEYDKRMLRILEASTDDTISVSTRDGLYQYL